MPENINLSEEKDLLDDDGYFGKRIAATYDDDASIFDPNVVDPVVDFLVDVAREGQAL